MKTWQAALAHVAVTAAQAAAGVTFFDPNQSFGFLANSGVQLGTQFLLTLLNVWVAKKNSNTDPNGQPLTTTVGGKFITKQD